MPVYVSAGSAGDMDHRRFGSVAPVVVRAQG